MENLIEELDKQRAKKKLNNRRFAEELGISESHWSRLKRGERHPSKKMTQRLEGHRPKGLLHFIKNIVCH